MRQDNAGRQKPHQADTRMRCKRHRFRAPSLSPHLCVFGPVAVTSASRKLPQRILKHTHTHTHTRTHSHTPVHPVSCHTGFLSSVSTMNPTGISTISGGNLAEDKKANFIMKIDLSAAEATNRWAAPLSFGRMVWANKPTQLHS